MTDILALMIQYNPHYIQSLTKPTNRIVLVSRESGA